MSRLSRLEALELYLEDTCIDLVHAPECDTNGCHTDICPVSNPMVAFRTLRQRLADVTSERDALLAIAKHYAARFTHTRDDGSVTYQWHSGLTPLECSHIDAAVSVIHSIDNGSPIPQDTLNTLGLPL